MQKDPTNVKIKTAMNNILFYNEQGNKKAFNLLVSFEILYATRNTFFNENLEQHSLVQA